VWSATWCRCLIIAFQIGGFVNNLISEQDQPRTSHPPPLRCPPSCMWLSPSSNLRPHHSQVHQILDKATHVHTTPSVRPSSTIGIQLLKRNLPVQAMVHAELPKATIPTLQSEISAEHPPMTHPRHLSPQAPFRNTAGMPSSPSRPSETFSPVTMPNVSVRRGTTNPRAGQCLWRRQRSTLLLPLALPITQTQGAGPTS
jgi:hypothetical protein